MRISHHSELQLSAEDRDKIAQVTLDLELSAEEREQVTQVILELIAMNVFRELQRVNELVSTSDF